MLQKLRYLLIFISTIFINLKTYSQAVDTSLFRMESRYSFYSFEQSGEFLIHIPNSLTQSNLSIEIKTGGITLSEWKGIPSGSILRLPFLINIPPSVYPTTAKISISWRPGVIYIAGTDLLVLPYKVNEVKTDRLTGGLIVNKKPFFPFGFYCYSPVQPTLQEEEVVKGFNMISPYQKILAETFNERKAYMDRCAEIGMKVHYQLLSLSSGSGGGVGSKGEDITPEEKRALLIAEIKTFMDHPALLAWYISDEPNGFRIPPEVLEDVYNTVRSTDPWHPVSIVFTTPFRDARRYVRAMDIVMADPYPIPVYPVTMINNAARQLKNDFSGKMPFWMVLQTFGGGEWWEREPTIQEIRTMTWQSVINGASGIQYFIRQGLNYFPKSTATWAECGRMSLEIAELTPWLLSDEVPPTVESASSSIIVTSRLYNGKLAVLAVNMTNETVVSAIRVRGVSNGKARAIFENRTIPFYGGIINDHISPYGTLAYLIDIGPRSVTSDFNGRNLIKDPGFENNYSPGVPSACYARPGGDRGATYFTDSREFYDGNHSLRLITPKPDNSISIRFFPCQVKAGSSYMISLWAKSDPEQRFKASGGEEKNTGEHFPPQYAEISFGDFATARFVPENEWRRFVTFVTIPPDTSAAFRTNLILRMPGQGVAWFDQIKVLEETGKGQ